MTRKRLPNRREIETVTFRLNGSTYHASIGYDRGTDVAHGDPLEIWMDAGPVGSEVQTQARSTAISSSLALQYGCSIKELRSSLPKLSNGKPADALGTFLSLVGE